MSSVRGANVQAIIYDEYHELATIRCVNCRHEPAAHLPDGTCLFGASKWQAPPPPRKPWYYKEFDAKLTVVDPAIPREVRERQSVKALKTTHNTRTKQVLSRKGRR